MKMYLLLVLLLMLLDSTFTSPLTSLQRNPSYVVKIWTKTILISSNYGSNFCTGILIRRNFLIANLLCITQYSKEKDPKIFVITAGPEIYRPFFNGATINHCREIFSGEEFTGHKVQEHAARSVFIITSSPFYISSRIQVIPINKKVLPVGDSGYAHVWINKTKSNSLIVMENFVGKIKTNSACHNHCYTIDLNGRKADGNGDIHVDSYFICKGYLAGVTYGPYSKKTSITKDTFFRTDIYDFLFPYFVADRAKKVNPVVLIMLFLMNALLTIFA